MCKPFKINCLNCKKFKYKRAELGHTLLLIKILTGSRIAIQHFTLGHFELSNSRLLSFWRFISHTASILH